MSPLLRRRLSSRRSWASIRERGARSVSARSRCAVRPVFVLALAALASVWLLAPTPARATASLELFDSWQPKAVSDNGEVVIGDQGGQAVYWRPGTQEVMPLGSLAGATTTVAAGVSADGTVIVGTSGGEAFRWTRETGMVGLGALPGGAGDGVVSDVSADGSIIVGRSGGEAFRWTSDTGMTGLGVLPGGTATEASRLSANGEWVIGSASSATGDEAFIWSEATGIRGLGYTPVGGVVARKNKPPIRNQAR